MTYELDKATGIATNEQGETFDTATGVLTMKDGTKIQTEAISDAAQEGLEEYHKILESK